MTNKNDVTIPRWHYRDVQADAQSVLKEAAGGAGIKTAMAHYIAEHQKTLPEGATPESVVEKILHAVDGFVVARNEVKSVEDVRKALRDRVSSLETAQALRYLATLDCVFGACDAHVCGKGEMPSVDEINARIQAAVSGAGDADVATRIDALAEKVTGDSLKAYVFASGLDELRNIAAVSEDAEAGKPKETAERVREAIRTGAGKGDVYAATACACYVRILEGKVPGVSKENVDVGVMTTLVVTGMEKASIISRLVRGEIDGELARDMLAALWCAAKWALALLIDAMVVLGVAGLAMLAVPSALAWLLTIPHLLLAVGLVLGLEAAMRSHEDIKKAIEWLGGLVASLTRMIGRGVAAVVKPLAEKSALVANAAPAAC